MKKALATAAILLGAASPAAAATAVVDVAPKTEVDGSVPVDGEVKNVEVSPAPKTEVSPAATVDPDNVVSPSVSPTVSPAVSPTVNPAVSPTTNVSPVVPVTVSGNRVLTNEEDNDTVIDNSVTEIEDNSVNGSFNANRDSFNGSAIATGKGVIVLGEPSSVNRPGVIELGRSYAETEAFVKGKALPRTGAPILPTLAVGLSLIASGWTLTKVQRPMPAFA